MTRLQQRKKSCGGREEARVLELLSNRKTDISIPSTYIFLSDVGAFASFHFEIKIGIYEIRKLFVTSSTYLDRY